MRWLLVAGLLSVFACRGDSNDVIDSGIVDRDPDAAMRDPDAAMRDPDAAMQDPSMPPDADPYCHYDCFGEVRCQYGMASYQNHAPVPCEYWEGMCPGGGITCTESCDVEFYYGTGDPHLWSSRLEIFCAETPAVQVGDPCGVNDCLPTRAVADADGNATQVYLECDWMTDTCVAAEPPELPLYLDPCPSTAARYGGPGKSGIAPAYNDTDNFDSVCLIAWDAATGVAVHGATMPCIGDWECPAGATCDDSLTPLEGRGQAVCRPGPRGAPLVDHLPRR